MSYIQLSKTLKNPSPKSVQNHFRKNGAVSMIIDPF